ncbi:hypothetical protein AL035_15605 [Salipiger aestuarii]|uniref:Holin n=1 Tax=Salipiger aestuarii TaxID=568098 RepID=A0A327YU86_9RHOB|nr:hypothetical protein [Salipiger aestuarii]KAB2540802.1 hypothetical protein AL035_15605 [Salipiger aestuarii]RAK24121.1 hypothetical protein ATI53_1001228 [Salipiger aestuarii]
MYGTKSPLASVTIWGSIIAIAPQVLSLVGIEMSQEQATGIAAHADAIITAVGGLIAIYGRVRAKSTIGKS